MLCRYYCKFVLYITVHDSKSTGFSIKNQRKSKLTKMTSDHGMTWIWGGGGGGGRIRIIKVFLVASLKKLLQKQWTVIWDVMTLTYHHCHYDGDAIMGAITSRITSLTIVYPTVYSHADQRKHQSSASLVFVRGIHRGPVNSRHKWPITRKMFPFHDVIMVFTKQQQIQHNEKRM